MSSGFCYFFDRGKRSFLTSSERSRRRAITRTARGGSPLSSGFCYFFDRGKRSFLTSSERSRRRAITRTARGGSPLSSGFFAPAVFTRHKFRTRDRQQVTSARVRTHYYLRQYRTKIVPQMRRGVPPVRARTGQFAGFAPLRSALHSYRTFVTRGLYFIDRCGRSASGVDRRKDRIQ